MLLCVSFLHRWLLAKVRPYQGWVIITCSIQAKTWFVCIGRKWKMMHAYWHILFITYMISLHVRVFFAICDVIWNYLVTKIHFKSRCCTYEQQTKHKIMNLLFLDKSIAKHFMYHVRMCNCCCGILWFNNITASFFWKWSQLLWYSIGIYIGIYIYILHFAKVNQWCQVWFIICDITK